MLAREDGRGIRNGGIEVIKDLTQKEVKPRTLAKQKAAAPRLRQGYGGQGPTASAIEKRLSGCAPRSQLPVIPFLRS